MCYNANTIYIIIYLKAIYKKNVIIYNKKHNNNNKLCFLFVFNIVLEQHIKLNKALLIVY